MTPLATRRRLYRRIMSHHHATLPPRRPLPFLSLFIMKNPLGPRAARVIANRFFTTALPETPPPLWRNQSPLFSRCQTECYSGAF